MYRIHLYTSLVSAITIIPVYDSQQFTPNLYIISKQEYFVKKLLLNLNYNVSVFTKLVLNIADPYNAESRFYLMSFKGTRSRALYLAQCNTTEDILELPLK